MRSRILGAAAAFVLCAPAAASAAFPHVVAPGESLYSVAAADGLSVSQLAAQNGVSVDSQLVAGTTLQIPPQSSAVAGVPVSTSAAPLASTTGATAGDGDGDADDVGETSTAAAPTSTTTTVSTGTGGYVVQPGDTLWAIATRSGISVNSLAASNGLDPNGLLISGHSISIPGASATSSTMVSTPVSTTQPTVVGAQSGGPYPTPERVSAAEVGSIGSANGSSPSLTQAVGWQESGFNNALTSSAGAVGVMQIMPGTWDWIQRTLTAGTPLNPSSAADNVRAGSLFLHQLLSATGGSPSLAAAGYYQGLASVQAHGMYSDTQAYVNSVLALQQHFGGG
jgi:LysM repeat protein